MLRHTLTVIAGLLALSSNPAAAQNAATPAAVQYDAALASALGGNEKGMRAYVLVLLKSGPNKVPTGPARTKMFEGHFANMQRLADEKKLAVAGPLDGVDGMRGMFILATDDIEAAKSYVATDPVIINGEMVAQYHKFYSSAALMMVNEVHNKIQKK